MTPRLALLTALAAGTTFVIPPVAGAAPCVPNAVGSWCFDSGDPTELPCIQGSFDPPSARLIECY